MSCAIVLDNDLRQMIHYHYTMVNRIGTSQISIHEYSIDRYASASSQTSPRIIFTCSDRDDACPHTHAREAVPTKEYDFCRQDMNRGVRSRAADASGWGVILDTVEPVMASYFASGTGMGLRCRRIMQWL